MSLFVLQIEPHLVEAFISHLEKQGYSIQPPESPSSPQIVKNHSGIHTITTKPTGAIVISTGLYLEAMQFAKDWHEQLEQSR
ncbi:hypothetical protein [Vibrio parahaemolyticus]|uniref:hypothetical protein n=1 Tax=Vibrio parahaemolyticus TaxID=670 RepID=UPI00300460F4